MSVLSNMCLVHEAVDEQLFLLVSSTQTQGFVFHVLCHRQENY